MKMNKFILFFIFSAFLLSEKQFVDGVVAKVENNIILHSEVIQTIQMQAMQSGIDLTTNPYFLEENNDKTLDYLINLYIIYEVAKKDTLIIVTGDEISKTLDGEINLMKERAGSLSALENILGQSIQEYKMYLWNEIEKRLLIEKYQQNFMLNITISRPEIVKFYNEYKDSIPLLPYRSKFSLIEFPINPSKKAETNTINMLNTIRDSILLFDNFEFFAENYSQDPGSKNNGGNLGYILRGNLVKEFEEIAFSLASGEISKPVKTKYGYHLIKTINKQGEKINVSHILIQIEPTLDDKNKTEKKIKDIYNKSINNINYFDSLANKYQLELQNQTGVFNFIPDNSIPFNILQMLEEYNGFSKLLSPIESDNNSFYLVYIKERKKEEKATLKNSWHTIETIAKNNKITNKFDMWINSLKNDIFIQIYKQ